MMDTWLRSAIGYIGDWLEFQLAGLQQPGVIIAIESIASVKSLIANLLMRLSCCQWGRSYT